MEGGILEWSEGWRGPVIILFGWTHKRGQPNLNFKIYQRRPKQIFRPKFVFRPLRTKRIGPHLVKTDNMGFEPYLLIYSVQFLEFCPQHNCMFITFLKSVAAWIWFLNSSVAFNHMSPICLFTEQCWSVVSLKLIALHKGQKYNSKYYLSLTGFHMKIENGRILKAENMSELLKHFYMSPTMCKYVTRTFAHNIWHDHSSFRPTTVNCASD